MITAPLARYEFVRDELDDLGPYPGRLGEALFGQVSSPQYWLSVRGLLLDGSPLVGGPTDAHVPLDESLRFGVCVHALLRPGCVRESAALALNTSHLRTSHGKRRGERIKQLDKIEKLIL